MTDSYRKDAWTPLRRLTAARIALGRAGASVPTQAMLEFQLAHARAVDAVYGDFDNPEFAATLRAAGYGVIEASSCAPDRAIYLRRPDLGRRLDEQSRAMLAALKAEAVDVALIVSNGLSAPAVLRQTVPLLNELIPRLQAAGLTRSPVVLVKNGRVAIQDEIGALLNARLSLMLVGERPGLSAPDSLGAYMEYAPEPGKTDAARNCVSNIRPEGLGHAAAADTLSYLITESLRRRLSGVELKDERVLKIDHEGSPSSLSYP